MPTEIKYTHIRAMSHTDITLIDERDNELLVPRAFVEGWGVNVLLVANWWAVSKGYADTEAHHIKIDKIRLEGKVPKEKSLVGRKACMDAMCHQCRQFNLEVTGDCGNVACPLYPHNPQAKLDPALGWEKVKAGSAAGLTPTKGLTDDDIIDGATRAVVFRYGSVESAPESVRLALNNLHRVAPAPGGTEW